MPTHSGNWYPYTESGSIVLATTLFIIVAILIFLAIRLHRPIEIKRPGVFVGTSIVIIWLLSVMTFFIAVGTYALALSQQLGHITSAPDPITPVTMTSGAIAFFVIIYLAGKEERSGIGVAITSAIVGTIAAPMIFELPFDLIVMWRTYPPSPGVLFTLLFFFPLFLIEISSFAMLALSPLIKVSRYTLFLLAGMFLIFAIWAVFGFAYPLTPIPTALNMISKVLAFATAVSLFVP